MIIDSSNGWIIALTIVIAIIYFGIIATVIFSPVQELAEIDEFDLDFEEQKVNAHHGKLL